MTTPSGQILVVDDHPTNRLKLSMAVKKLGHQATPAEDGQQALAKLRSEHYDLVLLDILMPEMDGYEVLGVMKADPDLRSLPVIVISSVDELESVVKAIELGAEDYLPKTFDPVLFQARVNACLEKKRLRDLEIEYLRQVAQLTDAANLLEAEDFAPEQLKLSEVTARDDPLGNLARVFEHMAHQVYVREQNLKRQVQELKIEIDKSQQTQQVSSITGTDYFQDLRGRAKDLRSLLKNNNSN